MKNLSPSNVLGVFTALAVVFGGFLMLPDNDDLRQQAENHNIKVFTREFYDADNVAKKREKMPPAKIMSREGREVELGELIKGKVTIINFWATWCAPCIEELPSLAAFQEANPEILVLPISLDMNKSMDDLAKVFKTEKLSHLRWFYDQAGVLRKTLSPEVYPVTYVLNAKGEIVYILQGPADWSSNKASMFAKSLLNKF